MGLCFSSAGAHPAHSAAASKYAHADVVCNGKDGVADATYDCDDGAVMRIKYSNAQLHSDAVFDILDAAHLAESYVSLDTHNAVHMHKTPVPAAPLRSYSCGDDNVVRFYDWHQQRCVDEWRGHTACVNRLLHAPVLNSVFSASRDGTIRQWRSGVSEAVQCIQAHGMSINGLVINPANTVLASGCRDYSVGMWDTATGSAIARAVIERNVVTAMRWVPGDQHCFVQASEDLTLRVWDVRTAAPVQSIATGSDIPLCCDVAPDGYRIVTGHNGFEGEGCAVSVWDRRAMSSGAYYTHGLNGGAHITQLRGHQQAVKACKLFAPTAGSGELLCASGSKDGVIKVWSLGSSTSGLQSGRDDQASCVATLELPREWQAVSCLDWTESVVHGSLLLAGTESGAAAWIDVSGAYKATHAPAADAKGFSTW